MSESEQTNVAVGKGAVVGTDRALLVVRFPLSPMPDQYWGALFHDKPMFSGWPMSLHPPSVNGSQVTLRIADADLEHATNALRDRVQQINQEYAERVLPQLEAEERRRQEAEAEREQRVSDAQKKLDELGIASQRLPGRQF
jgi:hypothetical protein